MKKRKPYAAPGTWAKRSWSYENLFDEDASGIIDFGFEGAQLLVTEYLDWFITYYATEAGR